MGQQGFGKSRSHTKEQQGQRIVHPNHSQIQVANVERVISKATRDMSLQDYLKNSMI